jgi:hypothetical protein
MHQANTHTYTSILASWSVERQVRDTVDWIGYIVRSPYFPPHSMYLTLESPSGSLKVSRRACVDLTPLPVFSQDSTLRLLVPVTPTYILHPHQPPLPISPPQIRTPPTAPSSSPQRHDADSPPTPSPPPQTDCSNAPKRNPNSSRTVETHS